MKADRFFAIGIVDKFSRMFMLLFAGIILGCTLGFAFYYMFSPKIGSTIAVIALYCILFVSYVIYTNSCINVSRIEVLKDRLAFIFEKKGKISTRQEILYSDIKEYKITPGTDKKNRALEAPLKDKFSLRIYGFKTTVETKDGERLEFKNSNSDGVLIYSPGYVYRLIDVKRCLEGFPLILENFDSKKDSEDFALQFKYYEENIKNLPFCKNKKYLLALFKYTLAFVLIASIIASIICWVLYFNFKSVDQAVTLFQITALIILVVVLPTYLTGFFSSVGGGHANKSAREKIETVIGGGGD